MAKPSIEDRLAIEDLFVRYTTALDEGDVEDVVGCFTDDGWLDSPIIGRHEGKAKLREFALEMLSAGDAEPNSVMSSATFASTSQARKAMRAAISSTSPLSPGSPRSCLRANMIASSGRPAASGCSQAVLW